MHEERGLTAILVTHDQTEANALADRIAVMEGGVLQQFDTPEMIKERPANLFTGTFVGEPPMNVFEAYVARRRRSPEAAAAGRPVARLSRRRLRARRCASASCSAERVVIGIRPYAVRRAQGGRAGDGLGQPVARRPDPYRRRLRRRLAGAGRARPHAAGARRDDRRRASTRRTCTSSTPRTGKAMSHGAELAVMRDVLIGIDAGTSVIKSVAFDARRPADRRRRDAEPLRDAARRRRRAGPGPHLGRHRRPRCSSSPTRCRTSPARIAAIAVTGQGDGTWLIDRDGEPVGQGLALARRARAPLVERAARAARGPAALREDRLRPRRLPAGPQLAWMQRRPPRGAGRARRPRSTARTGSISS